MFPMHAKVCWILLLKYVINGNAQRNRKHDMRQWVVNESSGYCVIAGPLKQSGDDIAKVKREERVGTHPVL